MCGIAGWIGEGFRGDASELVNALRHRGPDGSGIWSDPNSEAVFVHTRLSVVDLSGAGAQPMFFSPKQPRRFNDAPSFNINADPRFVLVFNGEIYNYLELRNEMEEAGEIFHGGSDTEVLLRLLVRDGAAAIQKLAGMFAFAFLDRDSGHAILARDRFGIKPLYYRTDDTSLAFASEAHVLRCSGDTLDASALRCFFLWNSVPEPNTLHQQIRQLSAGHLLRWSSGNAVIEQWYYPPATVGKSVPSARSAGPLFISRARNALEESISRHLVSDVPVGIFLSGGIDSTAVLALCRNALGPKADLRTFSIGFDDPTFDESADARRTAEHFRAQHTEWRMTSTDGAAEIEGYLAAVDQPTTDGFNTWCVSKLASREGMKVVLSGLGGDEWFGGYRSFVRVPRYRLLYRSLGPLRPAVATLLEHRPAGSPWRRLAEFLRGEGSWLQAYHAQRGIFTASESSQLVEALLGVTPEELNWNDDELPADPREIVSWLEVTRYMRNQLLRDSDTFSMAHGLELRVPLVDSRLAETLLTIPPKIRLRQGKQLLLEAVPEIPAWVRNKSKRGFEFPFQRWLEDRFGSLLVDAEKVSPVPLKAWYRTWAVAAAMRAVDRQKAS